MNISLMLFKKADIHNIEHQLPLFIDSLIFKRSLMFYELKDLPKRTLHKSIGTVKTLNKKILKNAFAFISLSQDASLRFKQLKVRGDNKQHN